MDPLKPLSDATTSRANDFDSAEMLRLAADIAGLSYYEWDFTTTWVPQWDARLKGIWGLPPDAKIDVETYLAGIHPDDRPAVEAAVARAFGSAGDGSYSAEYRVIGIQDRVERWVSSRGRVISAKGKPVRVIGTMMEVTSRKRAEEAGRRANDRLNLALKGSDIGIWELELPDGTFEHSHVTFSTAWEQLGYGDRDPVPDRATGMELIHPDDRHLIKRAFESYLANETPTLEWEHRVLHRDGSSRWMLNRGRAERDATGKPTRVVGSRVDITDRKHIEEELKRSEALLAEAQAVGRIGSWHWDLRTNLIQWSDEHYRILGLEPVQAPISAERALKFIHPDDLPGVLDVVKRATENHQPYDLCVRILRQDGTVRIAQSRGRAEYDATGKPLRMFGTFQDVTERKQLETDLRLARDVAEQANRVKDDFLATVSHELRTPLAAILLWSDLLANQALQPKEETQGISAIWESARSLQQLIEDLLDISRMLSGEMRLNARVMELTSVVQSAVEIVRAIANGKTIRIEEAIDTQAGPVRADPSRIQQVILNLLNNAVKFTPVGGLISVRLQRVADDIEIQVADTGQGISAEFLPHIFERFRQDDGGMTRRHGGLGLGLTIARELVELHGGTIRAASEGKDRGATFTIAMPLVHTPQEGHFDDPHSKTSETDRHLIPSSVLKGIRVLVVEDDQTNRDVVQYLLKECEAEVTAVDSAAGALSAFAANLKESPFDIILSDIGLAEMNGYELIQRIRRMESDVAKAMQTPAIALTAYARDEDSAAAMASGFNTHLKKPIDVALLIRAVGQSVGRSFDSTPNPIRGHS